jgi:Ca-activated chloride channel family protein
MNFTNPSALWLLLLLPFFLYIGWPRLPYRRVRDSISLGIRLLLVVLIILGLAGLQIRQTADKLAVVFILDQSDSMDAVAQRDALDYVRASIESMTEEDQAAVIVFGSNALVEEPMTDLVDLSQVGANPISLNTDLAEAIQLGLALFPPDTAKRMVILSDGIETTGDADRAARLAAASGVQIDYVPFSRQRFPEVLVNNVSVPSAVSQDEPFDVVVSIESETATQAELRVLAGTDVLFTETVDLDAGTTRRIIGPIQASTVGLLDFRVQIEPLSLDNFYRNNELAAFTRITGQPRIMMVASDSAELEYIQPALSDAGFEIDAVTPDDMPTGLASLSAYSSIILANVSATELGVDQMELLEIYVRDLGGGLVTVGGPDSYGVGGYFDTPLERSLPVDMQIRDQERIPQLSIVFVIDRSGSMELAGPSGITNLQLAKEAVLRSIAFLNDYDRVGVLSFDTSAFWLDGDNPIQDIGDEENRTRIQNLVASLRPGGGTDIFGGLSAADRELPDDPSELKHIVLLTDGGANDTGIIPLINRMFSNYDITTSVVATGINYETWMNSIPQAGGGNLHVATSPESIPTILAAETVLATRSYIFEEPFIPTLTARSPIMDGISSSPQLRGYVATTEKDTATVILRTPEEDPLLASWQYGLGRSVAFTSDATARWANDWITWDNYQRFWNQVVRWTITEGRDSNLEVYVEERGEEAVLVVDARDNRGDFLNALELNAAIVLPQSDFGERETINTQLKQVAPGQYETVFEPTQDGAHFIHIAGATREGATIDASIAESAGWVLSYSNEYRPRETDEAFLRKIAGITSGGLLSENPTAAFEHNLQTEEAAFDLWPYLLGLAAILLVLDIGVRRVVINRSDILRARERMSTVLAGGQRYEETETSTVLSGLKQAKQRASQPGEVDSVNIRQREFKMTGGRAPKAKPTPPPGASEQEEGTLASRLLKKRRDEE